MPAEAPNVSGLENHLSRQTPLDREVNRVAAPHLKLWVVLEAQDFTQSIGWYDGRRHCSWSRRSRDWSVHSYTEARQTRIGSGSTQGNACIAALDTRPIGIAQGRVGVYRLSEPYAQHG